MKNLKQELKNAIMERFKQHKIANALENELISYTEDIIFKKYNGTKIIRNGLKYQLYRVKVTGNTYYDDFKPKDLSIEIIYTIISEINKDEKSQLNKVKKKYEDSKYMGWIDVEKYKRKLWISEHYESDIDTIIENRLSLLIEKTIL